MRLAGPRARPQTRSMDHKTILHEGLRRQREALLAKLDGLPEHELRPVSYTHLTLPTICSV